MQKGKNLIEKKNFTQAITFFDKCIEINSTLSEPFNLKGCLI